MPRGQCCALAPLGREPGAGWSQGAAGRRLLLASPLRVSCSRILPWRHFPREPAEGWIAMSESTRSGPGRSTADEAFSELKKHVARRNEEAQKVARKLRAAREREQSARRRD